MIKLSPVEHKEPCLYFGLWYYVGMQRYASSVTSSETETQSPALHNVFERREEWRDDTLRKEVLESLPDQEEEVIGIITMEDVLEELLQVAISVEKHTLHIS